MKDFITERRSSRCVIDVGMRETNEKSLQQNKSFKSKHSTKHAIKERAKGAPAQFIKFFACLSNFQKAKSKNHLTKPAAPPYNPSPRRKND